jgi:IS5 family transposase
MSACTVTPKPHTRPANWRYLSLTLLLSNGHTALLSDDGLQFCQCGALRESTRDQLIAARAATNLQLQWRERTSGSRRRHRAIEMHTL